MFIITLYAEFRVSLAAASYFELTSPGVGRVQVTINDIPGRICDSFWDDRDAVVVCRMLGYG